LRSEWVLGFIKRKIRWVIRSEVRSALREERRYTERMVARVVDVVNSSWMEAFKGVEDAITHNDDGDDAGGAVPSQ
jgi:hypothetical protein